MSEYVDIVEKAHFSKIKKAKGITLVALIVTIIILLILAGISIATLTGSGLFENARLAEQKSKSEQEKEEGILGNYENKVNSYLNGTRNNMSKQILFSGSISSGTIKLSDSVNNYDFIIVVGNDGSNILTSFNAITKKVNVNDNIVGGTNGAYSSKDIISTWGFNMELVSEDGKEFNLIRSGYSSSVFSWGNVNITEIIGIKM